MHDPAPASHTSAFAQRKQHILAELNSLQPDLSPAGKPDARVLSLLHCINQHPNYVTLSSCSGRIVVFQNRLHSTKGGRWLVCSHDPVESGNVWQEVQRVACSSGEQPVGDDVKTDTRSSCDDYGAVAFKFEPLILHIGCATLAAAEEMLKFVLQCGCRESGIGVTAHSDSSSTPEADSKEVEYDSSSAAAASRYTVYVRTRLGLEAPIITQDGQLLVTEQYIGHLVQEANKKFAMNMERLARIEAGMALMLEELNIRVSDTTQSPRVTPPPTVTLLQKQKQPTTVRRKVKPQSKQSPQPSLTVMDGRVPVLCCIKPIVAQVQQACKHRNYNDTKRRIVAIDGQHLSSVDVAEVNLQWMMLPLTAHATKQLSKCSTPNELLQHLELNRIDSVQPQHLKLEFVAPELLNQPSRKQNSKFTTAKQTPTISQHSTICAIVSDCIRAHSLPAELLDDISKRWEKLGDIALLPATSFNSTLWRSSLSQLPAADVQSLYSSIAAALGCSRLGRQQPIATNDIKRRPRVQMLLGDSGETVHRENNVLYELDVTKVMFSSGNGTAKQHIIKQCSQTPSDSQPAGEIAVDMYAGIGYFTLPVLKHATHVQHLHAAEINDDSLHYLQRNMHLNKIDPSRYTIHPGDNRTSATLPAIYNTADRVLLGLIPSSEDGWPIALQLLKPTGGWLHVHANTCVDEMQATTDDIVNQLHSLCQSLPELHADKRQWRAHVHHVERVKSFAPRVEHIIVDVYMGSVDIAASHSLTADHLQPMYQPLTPSTTVPTVHQPTDEQFWQQVFPSQQPTVLTGVDVGQCVDKWSIEYLQSLQLQQIISVHVCPTRCLKFSPTKNYVYQTMSFSEMLQRMVESSTDGQTAGQPHQRYYMRAIGQNPRKEPANFAESFAALATDFHLPSFLQGTKPFSTVLRLSSADTTLWCHMDVVDNCLIQIRGSKRITLYPPTQCTNLHLDTAVDTSSSPITDIEDNPLLHEQYSRFKQAEQHAITITLHAGEILFIPALWFHRVTALDEVSIAVNVFWRQHASEHYEMKDLYGNRDLKAGAAAVELAHKARHQLDKLPTQGWYRQYYETRARAALQIVD